MITLRVYNYYFTDHIKKALNIIYERIWINIKNNRCIFTNEITTKTF